MFVDDNVSYHAVNEAYCLLMAYLREEKIGAKYNKEELKEFVHFVASILKHPENFKTVMPMKEDVEEPKESDKGE